MSYARTIEKIAMCKEEKKRQRTADFIFYLFLRVEGLSLLM
jgi:hypothetical protein